jgi:hypothetical protein
MPLFPDYGGFLEMFFFNSPSQAANEGFNVIDYDVERQLFVVEKEQKPFLMRARHDAYTVILPQQS